MIELMTRLVPVDTYEASLNNTAQTHGERWVKAGGQANISIVQAAIMLPAPLQLAFFHSPLPPMLHWDRS